MHTPFEISDLRPGEEAALASLIVEVIGATPYYSPEAIAAEIATYDVASLRERALAPGAVLVARADGALAGFCISRDDAGTVWIDWFGVAPAHRGRGIGAALLGALEDVAVARGAHKLWCDTRTENVESIRVLRAQGFTESAKLSQHWYRQDFYLWEKLLSQQSAAPSN